MKKIIEFFQNLLRSRIETRDQKFAKIRFENLYDSIETDAFNYCSDLMNFDPVPLMTLRNFTEHNKRYKRKNFRDQTWQEKIDCLTFYFLRNDY